MLQPGRLNEAAAGIDPMTRWALPAVSAVSPATTNIQPPEAAARWQAVLPDRVLSLTVSPAGETTAISLDGSATVLDKAGKVVSKRVVGQAEVAAAKKAAAVEPVGVGIDTPEPGGRLTVDSTGRLKNVNIPTLLSSRPQVHRPWSYPTLCLRLLRPRGA